MVLVYKQSEVPLYIFILLMFFASSIVGFCTALELL